MGANLSFKLDAGKILAKLHRGAVQAHKNMKWFNTGITDDENVDPEKVDDSKINFDIVESGEYELGVIIDDDMAVKIGQSVEDILKMFQGGDGEAGEEDDAEGENQQAGAQGGNNA